MDEKALSEEPREATVSSQETAGKAVTVIFQERGCRVVVKVVDSAIGIHDFKTSP